MTSGGIVGAATELLTDPAAHAAMANAVNPYGDGKAAGRIVAALEYLAGYGPEPVRFGPAGANGLRRGTLRTRGRQRRFTMKALR